MGRTSTKENKSVYQKAREDLNLSREQACELLNGFMYPEHIEKLENGKLKNIPPQDILDLAKAYKRPELCNYFCSNECPIGKEYVQEVKMKELFQIVLEVVDSINTLNVQKDKLVHISTDGKITNDELDEFVNICTELDKISTAVETLKLWTRKMLSSGEIDKEEYEKRINR